jgi:hypothetical protein
MPIKHLERLRKPVQMKVYKVRIERRAQKNLTKIPGHIIRISRMQYWTLEMTRGQ